MTLKNQVRTWIFTSNSFLVQCTPVLSLTTHLSTCAVMHESKILFLRKNSTIKKTPSPLKFTHSLKKKHASKCLVRSHDINFNSISYKYIIVHPLTIFVMYYLYILCTQYFNMTFTNITLNSMLGFFITFFGTL